MITAVTVTDDQIRDLRRDVMSEWSVMGKRTPWPEGNEILVACMQALGPASTARDSGRARCAAFLNDRDARLTVATVTDDQISALWTELTAHESAGSPIYGVAECIVALGLGDEKPSEAARHRARATCAAILNTRKRRAARSSRD